MTHCFCFPQSSPRFTLLWANYQIENFNGTIGISLMQILVHRCSLIVALLSPHSILANTLIYPSQWLILEVTGRQLAKDYYSTENFLHSFRFCTARACNSLLNDTVSAPIPFAFRLQSSYCDHHSIASVLLWMPTRPACCFVGIFLFATIGIDMLFVCFRTSERWRMMKKMNRWKSYQSSYRFFGLLLSVSLTQINWVHLECFQNSLSLPSTTLSLLITQRTELIPRPPWSIFLLASLP